jgi:hypothetical protein
MADPFTSESAKMDLVAALREEERVLQEKLEAVRRTLAIYDRGNVIVPPTDPAHPSQPPRTILTVPHHGTAPPRMDRFGSYGNAIIEKSISLVPGPTGAPMMTRDLVERLEREGMTVRGTDKVNALSALLARSSRLKAHGRRGWTRAESVRGVEAPKENEPSSGFAVGSDAADEGAPPPKSALGHSNRPAPGS